MKLSTKPRLLLLSGAVISMLALSLAISIRRDNSVDSLIEQLRDPENKARIGLYAVPGGEMMHYSRPMERLIALGDAAREPLHQLLGDEEIQNEVVLVLGAIGNERTVELLIETYRDPELPEEYPGVYDLDPGRFKLVCYSHALTYLTHESISRSRWGTDYTPGNRKKWQDWWAKNKKVFWVTGEPGHATFIPGNPAAPRTLKTIPQVLAQLDKALLDEDADIRAAAAERYWSLGAKAKDSVPTLIAALKDSDPKVRAAVAGSFDSIGPDAEDAIPALVGAMYADKNDLVRSRAAFSLAKLGDAAIPSLVKALQDKDPEVRRQAAWAICNHVPRLRELLPVLMNAAKDEDADVRASVLSTMEIVDSENPEVFKALLSCLNDPAAVVRRSCAYCFWRMGARAAQATEPLVKLLEDKDPGTRREAMNALIKIGSLTSKHVPQLTKLLTDETWEVRSSAAEALGKIGAGAKPAIGALRGTLRDPHLQVRLYSAQALGRIGPEAKAAIPDLIKALKDDDDGVRTHAAQALGEFGPEAKSAIPELKRLSLDNSGIAQAFALEALKKIDPQWQKDGGSK